VNLEWFCGISLKDLSAGNKFALRFFIKDTKRVDNMLREYGKERRLRQ